MNPISKITSPSEIDVGGKEITNTSPLPVEVLSHIFSFLPRGDKLNFAKTNYFNLFLFYASSVLKGTDGANARCQQGMSSIITIILNSPERINDPFVPCTPTGLKYLSSKNVYGATFSHQIQHGLPITDAIDNKKEISEAFKQARSALTDMHYWAFKISKDCTLEQRAEMGKSMLLSQHNSGVKNISVQNDSPFKGVLILRSLSKLDHPIALKAKSMLNSWLSDSKNRIWLISQCGVAATTEDCKGIAGYAPSIGSQVSTLFEEQITIFFQDIQTFKYQGNEAAAEKLILQLIDLAIALPLWGQAVLYNMSEHRMLNNLCLPFFQRLLDSHVIDNACKDDLRTHKAAIDDACKNDLSAGKNFLRLRDQLKNDPSPSFQQLLIIPTTGRPQIMFHPFYYSMAPLTIAKAEHIQKSIQFFQRVIDAGSTPLTMVLEDLQSLVKEMFKKAQTTQAEGFSGTDQAKLNEAIHLYEIAEKAGHPDAKVERLKLLISEKNDTEAQFELGNIYLNSANELFLYGDNLQAQKSVLMAQKQLENAANNGLVKAAVLVAQHYSTFTHHEPKFKPTEMFKNSDDKAMEFMDMAVRSGFENAKNTIYANEIPTYLKEIVEQFDSTGLKLMFNLINEYEGKWFDTDAHKLANLLKVAVEEKQLAALEKLTSQEAELEQELKIKLEAWMKEQERKNRKSQRFSNALG